MTNEAPPPLVPTEPSRPTTPEGLIFDLDGTLVDTVGARIDGWLEALTAARLEVSREEVGPMIGMDGKRLARLVAEANGREPSGDELEALDRAAGAAFDRRNVTPRPLPGARELLEELGGLGMRWVIATSSRREQVTASVASLRLDAEPDIVDGSHVAHAKPAPDLLLLAARTLGLAPERCWAVGDSTWDMRATVAAGETAIGVLAGSAVDGAALREAGAWRVLPTLNALAELLRR